MILVIAFLFLILSLIGVISITACVLCMEDEMDANSKKLQYLIHLTRIEASSLTGLSREDRQTLIHLREEVVMSEAVYRVRHLNIYDLDHDSDEDIYHLQYNSQDEEEEEDEEEELEKEVRWETRL